MKKVVKKTTEKYVTESTFEKSMQSVARSFERVEGALDIIIKEIKTIHDDNKNFRQSISSLDRDNSYNDRRIENLTMRVEKLEKTK
ncbi:MAG: hypothetical protein NTW62_03235 [Candidatus Nomurabacteria bacterium]|nr:hypothetical protein [Candidatus Nomurabacteria bacterium]